MEKEKLKSIDTIIIGSNTKNYLVRKCLQSLGFHIDSEVVVKDNKKYYIIIKFINNINVVMLIQIIILIITNIILWLLLSTVGVKEFRKLNY